MRKFISIYKLAKILNNIKKRERQPHFEFAESLKSIIRSRIKILLTIKYG
jgi:hypothetical protein